MLLSNGIGVLPRGEEERGGGGWRGQVGGGGDAVTSEGLASDVIVTLCFRRERQGRKVCDGSEAEFVL